MFTVKIKFKNQQIMKNSLYCQSCSMPLVTEEIKGTELNGSKSNEYCKYCYEKGAFKNPKLTLDEMKIIVKTQMKKMKLFDDLIERSVNILPSLKRWKNKIPFSNH